MNEFRLSEIERHLAAIDHWERFMGVFPLSEESGLVFGTCPHCGEGFVLDPSVSFPFCPDCELDLVEGMW